MKELLKKVTEGQNLTREEAAKAMDMMLEGTASPVLVSAFLTALRMKGETVDEIVGCTEMMKSKGGSVKIDTDEYIDFVGTGGDGANSFNISTTSMFVCAAAGVTVQSTETEPHLQRAVRPICLRHSVQTLCLSRNRLSNV